MIVLASLLGILLIAVGVLMIMAARYNGIWKMEGYGLCFKMKAGIVKVYEVTENHYSSAGTYNGVVINGKLYGGMGKFTLRRQGDKLSLVDEGSQTIYKANKQGKDYFSGLNEVTDGEQIEKFKLFYETFKENYAFADMYGVNFDEEYNKYSSSITDATSDEELFRYMCNMVEKLDDGHVEIYWSDRGYCPSDYMPEWMENAEQGQLLVNVIKSNYLHDYHKFDDCYIRYGTISEDIGYIIMQAIGMEELNKSASTKKAMDKIIKEFQDKKSIVIDLRFCSGGYDEASLLLAGYFTKEQYLAHKKQAYDNGSYTELQNIYVKPMDITYDGEIIILTSGYTISAGESYARAMLANKKNSITVIGETTAGYYSDAIPKFLPGGFSFNMSVERYYWYDDTMLEGKGIEPDIEIPFNLEKVQEGKDPVLDCVIDRYAD